VSFLTDGFKFAPKTLEQAMMICELEPVISQLERDTDEIVQKRTSCRMPPPSNPTGRFYSATGYANSEPLSKDVYPKRKEHPNLRDTFVELVPASRRGLDPANRAGSNLRSSRLLTEIQSIAANPHPHIDVYVSERDMSFWKIVMQGPPDSIYAAGTFVLYLDMEESYPTFAPKCRFVTSIYHPNVNKHGRICHSIFDRNWTSDTTSSMVLYTVYGLLLVPDYSDPV
jgi:ubiquitin-protein ligase